MKKAPFHYPKHTNKQNALPPSFLKVYLAILHLRQARKQVSVRVLGHMLGWSSPCAVASVLERLEKLGLITRQRGVGFACGTIVPQYRMEFWT